MEEKRKYVRLDTRLKINYRVLENPPPPINTEILDIGGGGIRLLLAEPLKVKAVLDLEVYLPNETKPIHCQGRVVWIEEFSILQRAKEEKKTFEAGVEFTDVRLEDRDQIIKYVILGYAGKEKK